MPTKSSQQLNSILFKKIYNFIEIVIEKKNENILSKLQHQYVRVVINFKLENAKENVQGKDGSNGLTHKSIKKLKEQTSFCRFFFIFGNI